MTSALLVLAGFALALLIRPCLVLIRERLALRQIDRNTRALRNPRVCRRTGRFHSAGWQRGETPCSFCGEGVRR